MKKTLAVLGAMGLALGAGIAVAQPPGPGGPGRRGPGGVAGLARVLALTDQQQAQVRTIMEEGRADHEALRARLRENREATRAALASPSPDPVAVGELEIAAHRLREEARALREHQEAAIRALLTTEQRTKFDLMREMRRSGRPRGERGPMGGPGMPPPGDDEGRR